MRGISASRNILAHSPENAMLGILSLQEGNLYSELRLYMLQDGLTSKYSEYTLEERVKM